MNMVLLWFLQESVTLGIDVSWFFLSSAFKVNDYSNNPIYASQVQRLYFIILFLLACCPAQISAQPIQIPSIRQLRVMLAVGENVAIGSFHSDADGAARAGTSIMLRIGLRYHERLITSINYSTHKLGIDRPAWNGQNVQARWYIWHVGISQRYLFSGNPYRLFGEVDAGITSADLETEPKIFSISQVGSSKFGGSIGFGIEKAFEAPTVLELGCRLNYTRDQANYGDLVFTFLDFYIGLSFVIDD